MSLKFAVLAGIQDINILFFNKKHKFYNLLKNYLTHEGDMDIAKCVQWMDDCWRLVFGQNFSGKFTTSHSNTEYSIFCLVSWLLEMCDKYPDKAKQLLEAIVKCLKWRFDDGEFPELGWLVYGDDGLFWNTIEGLEFLNLDSFMTYMKDTFNMDLKPANCGEYSTLISQTDNFGNLKTRVWKFRGDTYWIPHGPVFLKRHFILLRYGKVLRCVPFRPVEDYFARAGKSVSERLGNPLIELVRIHGLMYDSMGTNPYAYCFLDLLRREILDFLNGGLKGYAYPDEVDVHGPGNDINQALKRIKEKLVKGGFGEYYIPDLLVCPSWETLQKLLDHSYTGCWGRRDYFERPSWWDNVDDTEEFPC